MCTCALKTRTASRDTRHRCFPIVEREAATRRERAAFLQWIRQDVRGEEVCRGEWGLARGAAEAGVGAEGQVTARTSAAGSQQRQASWRTRREECLFSLGDLSPPLGAAGLWSDMMHVGDAQPFPFCAKTRAGGTQPPGGGSRPTLGVKGLCPPPTAPSVSTACGESAFVRMFLNSCSEKCHHLTLEGRRKEGAVQGRGEQSRDGQVWDMGSAHEKRLRAEAATGRPFSGFLLRSPPDARDPLEKHLITSPGHGLSAPLGCHVDQH